jgi:indolepyruvate ferredoxin oxidoreductase
MHEKVDVVIVGAGASGSAYAAVMAKAGKKVVMIEEGPDWQLTDLISSDIWGRRIKPAGAPFLLEGKNPFGYAYQAGALPLSAEAIERAIEMNGEAVAMNVAAFRYGRRAVVDPAALEALVKPAPELVNDSLKLSQSFAETVDRRVAFLTAYQSARYARRYRKWVEKVKAAEAMKAPGQCALSEAVARYLFKLMAYKDEYEVARLYTDTSFVDRVKSTFDGGNLRFEFHLAPPLLARRDKVTGEPKKMSFGPWLLGAFRVLKKFKVLRGTPLDPFGYTAERRTERRLIAEYCELLRELCERLTPENHAVAVGLTSLPEKIRGFGPNPMATPNRRKPSRTPRKLPRSMA